MHITIVGSNCSNGIKLKKNIIKAINEIDENIELDIKDDKESQIKYNIKNIPGLIIEDKKYSEGNVPSTREIVKIIKSYITI